MLFSFTGSVCNPLNHTAGAVGASHVGPVPHQYTVELRIPERSESPLRTTRFLLGCLRNVHPSQTMSVGRSCPPEPWLM